MIEFWRAGGPIPFVSADEARVIEADGWDGQMVMDSQALSGDPYAIMTALAAATTVLRVSPGVTNPLTRHPAVTAAAISTVQAISGGRAVLGIGRGDSALAFLGRAPMKPEAFGRALEDIQALLRGDELAVADAMAADEAASSESLALGRRPTTARLDWLPEGIAKVPLDVAATGPKVIAMAARIAERVTFSVGAIPERLAWAVELARAARVEAGLPADGPSYGAQVIVVAHPDRRMARDIAAGFAAPLARFQVIQGDAAGPTTDGDRQAFATIRAGYDMTRHHKMDKFAPGTFSDDFVERFAIVGTAGECVERLVGLTVLGIGRFVVVGPGLYAEPGGARPGTLFAREVMPAVRARARQPIDVRVEEKTC